MWCGDGVGHAQGLQQDDHAVPVEGPVSEDFIYLRAVTRARGDRRLLMVRSYVRARAGQ